MVTKADLISQVQAKAAFFAMPLLNQLNRSDASNTLDEYHYMIYYRVGAYLKDEFVKILVKDKNTPQESAEWMNGLPVILQPAPVDSAWKTAVLAKKASLLADTTIKRIDIRVLNEEEKWAIAVAYQLSSGKVAATPHFIYDLNGVLTSYPYTGTIYT